MAIDHFQARAFARDYPGDTSPLNGVRRVLPKKQNAQNPICASRRPFALTKDSYNY
jgi:hypothetical protein